MFKIKVSGAHAVGMMGRTRKDLLDGPEALGLSWGALPGMEAETRKNLRCLSLLSLWITCLIYIDGWSRKFGVFGVHPGLLQVVVRLDQAGTNVLSYRLLLLYSHRLWPEERFWSISDLDRVVQELFWWRATFALCLESSKPASGVGKSWVGTAQRRIFQVCLAQMTWPRQRPASICGAKHLEPVWSTPGKICRGYWPKCQVNWAVGSCDASNPRSASSSDWKPPRMRPGFKKC